MLPHFVFHSEMSSLEGSKYKARGLEARNTRLEGSRLEGSRLEIQGSKARGSRARGSKARHIEYSLKLGFPYERFYFCYTASPFVHF